MFYFHGAKGRDFAVVSDTSLQLTSSCLNPTGEHMILHGSKPSPSCSILTVFSLEQKEFLMMWKHCWQGGMTNVHTDGEAEWQIEGRE